VRPLRLDRVQARVRPWRPRSQGASSGCHRRRGLSLVETLVVLGVVAVLLSILLTVFHTVIRFVQSWR